MILEAVIFFNALAFVAMGLGYWLKSKAVMFAGSALLMIIGAAMMLPDVFGGGIEYANGIVHIGGGQEVCCSYTETYTYAQVNTTMAGLIGLVLILLSVYMDYAIFFEEELE